MARLEWEPVAEAEGKVLGEITAEWEQVGDGNMYRGTGANGSGLSSLDGHWLGLNIQGQVLISSWRSLVEGKVR